MGNSLGKHIILLILALLSLNLTAQVNHLDKASRFRETVWLNTDRHYYIAGEIVRFNATVLEQDSYKRSSLSKNIRVELLDSKGTQIHQKNLILQDSRIEGNILLPKSISSGLYYLRSYTSWMRNFEASAFGLVELKVYNPNDDLASFIKNSSSNSDNTEGDVVYEKDASLIITRQGGMLKIELSRELQDAGRIRLIAHQSYSKYWDSGYMDGGSGFSVSRESLPNGIIQFTALTEDQRILARQLWSDYERGNISINFNTDENNVSLNETHSFDYLLPGNADEILINVAMEEPGQGCDFIGGLPGWPCTGNIPADAEEFRLWLWNNSYPDQLVFSLAETTESDGLPSGIEFLPETRSGVVSGKVIDKASGLGKADVGVSISVLNNNYFDACFTDNTGRYYFALPDLEGSIDYIVNFTEEEDSTLQLFVNQEFHSPPSISGSNFYLDDEEIKFFNTLSTNFQLRSIYGVEELLEKPVMDSIKGRATFFHPPDMVIVLDDFIKLANLREIIYEVVPNVSVRKEDGREIIRVNADFQFDESSKTLVLLDGIPLTNPGALLDLTPDRIERIEVKSRLYVYGRRMYSAIVNFVSPNKDYAGLDLPGNSILSTYSLAVRESGRLIKTEIEDRRIPRLDATLLWRFQQGPISTVQFASGDASGKMLIQAKGFDSHGNWISGKKQFLIKE